LNVDELQSGGDLDAASNESLDPLDSLDPVEPLDRVAAEARESQARKEASPGRVVREYAFLAVAAIVLASLVRAFLGQAYWIPSESMYPTLKIGDRVIVSRLSYKVGDPSRGDIVVFQNPEYRDRGRKDPVTKVTRGLLELVGIGQPKDKYFIKRVIGMPGDRFQVKGEHVWVNGKQLPEKWLKTGVRTLWDSGMTYGDPEFTIPAHHYFMMGDNREQSKDSRFFGPIARKKMVGRAFVRIWPVGRFGGL
jgi:signal peptidase I